MIFRLILWIIIILCVVFFVVFNVEPRVQVHLFPGMTIQNIPLAIVIIVSFVFGLLCGVILSLSQVIKYKMQLRKLNKKLKEEKEQEAKVELQKTQNQEESSSK